MKIIRGKKKKKDEKGVTSKPHGVNPEPIDKTEASANREGSASFVAGEIEM